MKRLILLAAGVVLVAAFTVVAQSSLDGSSLYAAKPSELLTDPVCTNTEETGGGLAGCRDEVSLEKKSGDTPSYLETLTNVFIYAGGVVAVAFLIFGGVKYVNSAGDAARVQSAKNTIVYAIVGLIVVALARAIIGFVIGTL